MHHEQHGSVMSTGHLQSSGLTPLTEKHQWRKEFSTSKTIYTNAVGARKENLAI